MKKKKFDDIKYIIEEIKKMGYVFTSEVDPFSFYKETLNPVTCYGKQRVSYELSTENLYKELFGFFTPFKLIGQNPSVLSSAIRFFRDEKKMTFREIAEIVRVKYQTCQYIYQRSYAPPKRTKWSEYRPGMLKYFRQGKTVYWIAKKYGTDRGAVKRQLVKAGVKFEKEE